jgi:hypothetical protein
VRGQLAAAALSLLLAGGVARADEPPPGRIQAGGVPVISYNPDLGVGVGALFSLARVHPDASPFVWRLRINSVVHLNPSPEFGPVLTQQAHSLLLQLPGLAHGRLRIEAALVGFDRTIAPWYGLGNASAESTPWEVLDREQQPEAWAIARRHHRYRHSQVRARVEARLALTGDLELLGAIEGGWNRVEAYPGSSLEAEFAAGQRIGRGDHGLLLGQVGLVFDSRDDEVSPSRGGFHELTVRGGPVLGQAAGYAGIHAALRGYLPLHGDRMTVALRLVSDVLLGDPPVYEYGFLPGVPQVPALGGSRSLRGVPAGRYQGAVRLLAGAELRSWWTTIAIRRLRLRVGGATGVDLGRVWAELGPRGDLDGQTLGLKVGITAGLRLRWGRAFVVRIDGAWSEQGMGIYLDAGQAF